MIIVIGSAITLAIFLAVGWAVSAEMFQQRWWRRKVAEGDVDIVGALIHEAMADWRRSKAPKDLPANTWAGVQGADLVAVTPGGATFSASVVPQYQTEDGRRVKVTSDLEEAVRLAARLMDMIMYDVPNLRLSEARLDIYATVTGDERGHQPVLSTTAYRTVADELAWDELTPHEILGRFETIMAEERDGVITPIELPPVEGVRPRPAEEAAAEALKPPRRES